MRFTIKNPGQVGNYRIPEREKETMYMLEVEIAGVHRQEGNYIPAYFGKAVDKLGRYEDIGSVEEIKDKLTRLEVLERREAG